MFILALDCSTARGSVALVDTAEPSPRYAGEFPAGRGQGGLLFTTVQAALSALPAGEKLGEIIVGLGPGSYSGVRQSIALAVGLSAATGAVLRGVPSPLALETDAPAFHVVGDARRGAFYHTSVENGVPLPPGPALLPDRATLDDHLFRNPNWPLFAVETAAALLPPGAQPALPLAARLLRLPPGARTLPPLEPIYLRPVTITLPKPKG